MCVRKIEDLRLDWFSARRHCNGLGGDLATDAAVNKAKNWLISSYGITGEGDRWDTWQSPYVVSLNSILI